MSSQSTAVLSLVEASAKLPSPPARESIISSERAFIGIDGENFRFMIKDLGYESPRIPDLVSQIASRLNIVDKKGIIQGVFVTPRNFDQGERTIAARAGISFIHVTNPRKEADDAALREAITKSPASDILVVVSNDLKGYVNILADQKKRRKRVVIVGNRKHGWAEESNKQIAQYGFEFIDIGDFIDRIAKDVSPIDNPTPAPSAPIPIVEPRASLTQKTTTSSFRDRQNNVEIFFTPPDHPNIVEAVYVIYEAVDRFNVQDIQIQITGLRGNPESKTTQISFTAYPTTCARIILRVMEALEKYVGKNKRDFPEINIRSSRKQ